MSSEKLVGSVKIKPIFSSSRDILAYFEIEKLFLGAYKILCLI